MNMKTYEAETLEEAFPLGCRVTDDQGQVSGIVTGHARRGNEERVEVDFGDGAKGWSCACELRRER